MIEGMTLRDWFAGQALAGLTAAIKNDSEPVSTEDLVRAAYACAEAMLVYRREGDQRDRLEPDQFDPTSQQA